MVKTCLVKTLHTAADLEKSTWNSTGSVNCTGWFSQCEKALGGGGKSHPHSHPAVTSTNIEAMDITNYF